MEKNILNYQDIFEASRNILKKFTITQFKENQPYAFKIINSGINILQTLQIFYTDKTTKEFKIQLELIGILVLLTQAVRQIAKNPNILETFKYIRERLKYYTQEEKNYIDLYLYQNFRKNCDEKFNKRMKEFVETEVIKRMNEELTEDELIAIEGLLNLSDQSF